MNIVSRYFNWLQKDNPAGEVEKYPEIDQNGETSVKGIYIIGDLTGIPLLKLASESGKEMIDRFNSDSDFKKQIKNNADDEVLDFIIIGAGISGISAGLEAKKQGFNFCIIESNKKFNTLVNFPKGKPIFAEPNGFTQKSDLKIDDGTKESLLEDLHLQIKDARLPVEEELSAQSIIKKNGIFEVDTGSKTPKALRIIIAIGKTGNPRMLKVPGEDKPKVFAKLFDPEDAQDHDVLVVGGGDSALETAIATAQFAKSVKISYRRNEFSRPKEGNKEALDKLVRDGKIELLMETNIKEIKDSTVILTDREGKAFEIKNSMVFKQLGTELPTQFFRRAGIKIEGDMNTEMYLRFALLLLVSCVIYFGKSSADFYKYFLSDQDSLISWGSLLSQIFSIDFWGKFFSLPGEIFGVLFSDKARIWNVSKYINAAVAYFSFNAVVFLGIYLLAKFIFENYKSFKPGWQTFKYAYFIFMGIFFAVIFFGERYFGLNLFGKGQSFYYTGFYSLTILIFGLHRIQKKPTKYIKRQTWSLILIQAVPLFILPEIILPLLGNWGVLGGETSFLHTQVFPKGEYWRAYGFILAWPLFFFNLFSSNLTAFWLVTSLVQTFVIIPYIVYKWGKGAYCGWICSCGALAETLGDDYRHLAPHGPKAKKWENFGQWALLAAFIITGLKLIAVLYNFEIPVINEKVSYAADFLHKFYYIGIDVIFAGVLGLGVYFFLSGRVWCRFGCPLAALMHIYARFTRYRIFSDKKKCISCNICTKVCHMGIDVMNFANKGIPMNDVECVRCSACVVNCPTEVLSFGSQSKADPNNVLYKNEGISFIPKNDWKSGL